MMKRTDKKVQRATSQSYGRYFSAVTSIVTVLLFFGTLIALGCITLFSEKSDFSETQNRYLAKFPKITVKNYFNGSFMTDTADYVSDHFAFHDSWIKVNTALDMLSGKRELNGIYITGERMAEKITPPNAERTEKSISGIRKFAEENELPVYLLIAPTQAEIYRDELPAFAQSPDQQQFIEDVYEQLSDVAVTIDVYGTLYANREDYIYYRTDHHWTTAGAFTAYTAAGKKMGYTPLGEDSYDIEHAGDGFLGTFYSKSLWDGVKPDTLDLWLPTDGKGVRSVKIYSAIGQEPVSHEGMYFREFLDVKDKYSVFFGTNQPMITVDTGREGDRLLIFKDSYAHCFVPFLTAHYSKITMVDLRYINMSYKDIIDVSDYDCALFLYNASTFMSDENLKKLNY
ncbi:MAG: hypothetical protein K2K57_02955 [Oscillospiraceae bacterium]|nr:hypothetical protein [Oscillospiraceae bacterium]